ncbi:MAG: hypothetical protein V4692_14460 [Bdellovibrionota bacterium]
MRFVKLVLLAFAVIHFSACSSSSKDVEPAAPTASAEPVTLDTLDRYSIQELDSAATLLRAINEASAEVKGDGNPGEEVVGCAITGRQAKVMHDELKGLINRRIEQEAKDYAKDPRVYAKNNGFETCGGECHCGVLATVLERTRTDDIVKMDMKVHSRFLTKLNAKARLQGSTQISACARKQTWFCSSDLKTYLAKSAP